MSEYILNLLPLNQEERAAFEAAAPNATHVYAGRRTATPEQYAQATVVFGWPRPKDLAQCQHLKWFQTMWAGSDEYTASGLFPSGAILTSSAGSNSQSVAEHMLASLLALCRKLPQCRDNQIQGHWVDVGNMKTISGATVLVVGAGNIGSAFASRCRALGAHTVGLKRTVTGPIDGFDQVFSTEKLDELLPQADVVALSLPHSAATAKLMNAQRFALMKEDAIFLNAGRGSAVDQDALADTLRAGKLWGAALDVTDPEPLPDGHPLWSVPNLLITPHVAGGMRLEITRATCVQMALDNLKRYLNNEPLHNTVQL